MIFAWWHRPVKKKDKLFDFTSVEIARSRRGQCPPEISADGMSCAIQFLMICILSNFQNQSNTVNWVVAVSGIRDCASQNSLSCGEQPTGLGFSLLVSETFYLRATVVCHALPLYGFLSISLSCRIHLRIQFDFTLIFDFLFAFVFVLNSL
jgi:hypothetical protein